MVTSAAPANESRILHEIISTAGSSLEQDEVLRAVVRLLSDHTALGVAYRVDMRLRPDGTQGALARSFAATLAAKASGSDRERVANSGRSYPIGGTLFFTRLGQRHM